MRDRRRRFGWLDCISAALLLVTALKVLLVCLSQPIAAYANNYDFVRQSSCVGVWEDYGDRDKTKSDPERPVDALVYDGDRRKQVCLPSSDNLFPWAVAHLAGKGAHMQLRQVGLAKVIVMLSMLAVVMMQGMAPSLRLALSVGAMLVLGDFALGLYVDTLYLEVSVIVFSFMSIALAVVAYCGTIRPGRVFLVALLVSLCWLGFARLQYAPIALLVGMAAAGAMIVRWRDWRQGVLILAVALGTQAGFHMLMANTGEPTRQMDRANSTDTFLGAVLPAAHDKPAALRIAGRPQSCAGAIGKTWYSAGFQTDDPCPAVYDLGRLRLLRLFAYDPRMFGVPLLRVIHDSRPSLLPYLGHFEDPAAAPGFVFRALAATSLSTWLAALPDGVYCGLIISLCALAPICFVAATGRAIWSRNRNGGRRGDAADGALLLAGFGGALAFYALLSSAFGDGYYEVQRHALGVLIGCGFAVAAVALVAADIAARITSARARTPSCPRTAEPA